jgi:replicative DNA helicase
MSTGFSFLHSALANGDWRLLRRAKDEMFTEEELGAFTFIRDYLDRYKELPPLDVVASEGFSLPRPRRSAACDYWLDTLKRRFAYTKVDEKHPQLVQAMQNQNTDAMLAVLREMVAEASLAVGGERYTTLRDEVTAVKDDYLWARSNPGLRGIPSGWSTLDLATMGFMGGDVIVLAGRPSMGKSYLLLEMANASYLDGSSTAIVSMEMTTMQMVRRWVGRRSGFNPNLIRDGGLTTYSHEQLLSVIAEMENGETPVYMLAGDMRKSVAGIEAMVMEFAPKILFIDAAYLLTPSGRKTGYISKWESISEVICELKQLAIRYDIPVVISVQFNRNQKSKGKKELDLGDIAGSDSIPQDASVVLGIRQGPAPYQRTQRIVEVMKNREGDTPRFATAFTFNPVSMVEVPFVDEADEIDEETSTVNTNWMV